LGRALNYVPSHYAQGGEVKLLEKGMIMGTYTVYDDPEVDQAIDAHMSIIVKIMRSLVPDIIAVYLSGGFGRGEGSVIVQNGAVRPLKDYDIVVIVPRRPSSSMLAELENAIYKGLRIDRTHARLFRFSEFVVDIAFLTPWHLRFIHDIAMYELKVGSRLLYGTDVRRLIPLKPSDVPLSSGLRLLFEKITGLVGTFKAEYAREKTVPARNKWALIYECLKTYVEVGTALCLLMGRYSPSFRSRATLFEEEFPKKLPVIYTRFPDLTEKVRRATEFKLKPNLTSMNENPVDLWFRTRDMLCEITRYFMQEYLHIPLSSWVSSNHLLQKKLDSTYPRALAQAICRSVIGIDSEPPVRAIILAMRTYYNLRYALQVRRNIGSTPISMLVWSPLAIIKIFLTGPLVLLSLNESGEVIEPDYTAAVANLGKLLPSRCIPSVHPWNEIRKRYILAYNSFGLRGPR
jgi:predicted nucleotidyltransferase